MELCQDEEVINILLLGKNGVGKSTFINYFANYHLNPNFELDKHFICPIETKQEEKDEFKEMQPLATQVPEAYTFQINDGKLVRFIDTPGIFLSETLEDQETFENIIDFIKNFKHLHGICLVLQPGEPLRFIEYFLWEIMTRFDKSASNNLIYVFTKTHKNGYQADNDLNHLHQSIKYIEQKFQINIPFNKFNTFYFDNEGFNYLNSVKFGIEVGDFQIMKESWIESRKAMWNLLSYIMGDAEFYGLRPHSVKKTVLLNKVRRLILQTSKPLNYINDLIIDSETVSNENYNQEIMLSLKNEHDIIFGAIPMFVSFFEQHALCPINVAYDEPVDDLFLLVYKAFTRFSPRGILWKQYFALKKEHNEIKKVMAENTDYGTSITSNEIVGIIEELCNLKFTGAIVKVVIQGIIATNQRKRSKLQDQVIYLSHKKLGNRGSIYQESAINPPQQNTDTKAQLISQILSLADKDNILNLMQLALQEKTANQEKISDYQKYPKGNAMNDYYFNSEIESREEVVYDDKTSGRYNNYQPRKQVHFVDDDSLQNYDRHFANGRKRDNFMKRKQYSEEYSSDAEDKSSNSEHVGINKYGNSRR